MGQKKHHSKNPRWANEIPTTQKGLPKNKKLKIKLKNTNKEIREAKYEII